MRVFVTGGTGFIGTPLLQHLVQQGHEVLVLVQAGQEINQCEVQTVAGDLKNMDAWQETVAQFKPDAAIHLAWEGIPDYGEEMSARNAAYGKELFRFLFDAGCQKIVSAGSCWEYEKTQGLLHEDQEVVPEKPFAKAKDQVRKAGMELAGKNSRVFVWARFFYVYGPRQKESSLIPSIIESVRTRKTPEIKTPDTKNDFVYVDDVAEALVHLIEKAEKSATYNVGTGKTTAVREIVQQVCDAYEFSCTLPGVTGETPINFGADMTKIKNELGWEPKTSLHAGIEKTMNYFNRVGDSV